MRISRFLGFAVVALLLTAAGCGGGGDDNKTTQTTPTTPSQSTAGQKAVTVKLAEYSFTPKKVTIAKGGTITAQNVGKIAHDLTIEQGPNAKVKSKKLAGTPQFPPGSSQTLTVNLKPGTYGMVCTVPGHRQLGMVGTITVK
jgi:uncharacterized cupredoxin-like copper-binding protein